MDTVIKSVHYTTSEKFGLDTVIKYVHYTPSGKNELDTIIYMGKNSISGNVKKISCQRSFLGLKEVKVSDLCISMLLTTKLF